MLGQNSSVGIATHTGNIGSSDFIMDDVSCSGDETSLLECDFITDHNCGAHEAAGVICVDVEDNGEPVKLVGGDDTSGNVLYHGRPVWYE